jgi:L-lactate dehydrogenase complex protein LldG
VSAAAEPASPLWRHFAAKAELVSASVVHVDGADGVARLLRERAARPIAHTASIAEALPDLAAVAGARVERGQAPASETVALGRLAVVETGSVLLDEPDADRAACFLAERLWVVVRATDIVQTLEDALERIATLIGSSSHHPQLVTGPSRTADIERTLTVGVHGPRELVIAVMA